MAHDVFISYSNKDKPVADAACAGLEARGIRCWIAPRDILPGVDWGAAIIDAITGCKVMVLIFSGNANTSQQIKREVERAVAKGVKLLPFRIEDVPLSKNLEYFISTAHWLDALTQPLQGHIARLVDTVESLMARDSRTVPSDMPPPTSPRPIPPLAPLYRPSKKPFVLIAAAAVAIAAWYAMRKTPPKIVAINFPASFAAGSRSVTGTVQYQAGHDPIAQAQFDVISAENFDPFTVQPSGLSSSKQGSFSFAVHSSVAQQVVLRATLIDAAGRRSSPVSFSFEAKKAAAQKSIDIPVPPFKFKIPR